VCACGRRVFVCVRVWQESVCACGRRVFVCARVWQESVCVCVCVCVRVCERVCCVVDSKHEILLPDCLIQCMAS